LPSALGGALLLLPAVAAYKVGDIKHFLVLFYENRAFDHIFGCSADQLPGIDGVKEGMGNWLDPNDHSKGFVPVGCGEAKYVCDQEPDHSFTGTTKDIWGPAAGPANASHSPYAAATMSGYANHSRTSMRAFNASQLPVKIGLAKEFGLFNNLCACRSPVEPTDLAPHASTS
jgi:phospholipase C